jgi:stage III sporulation protein AA
MYAYDEALRQGYITIKGGHRIGICGKGVIENEKIKILKQISSLNIRIANECIGCSDNIMSKIYKNKSVDHTLIISPPYAGKTTMLRDILRRIAMDYNVGIVDERGEIAATYMGVIQNDLGENVDVLDNCPKAEGIPILVRTMAPDVIGIDEIGGKQDIEALIYSINCGCKIYATIHGTSIEDVRKKPYINKLIDDKIFKYYIVLSYNGKTRKEEVYEV